MFNHRTRAGIVGALAACSLAGACLAPAASQAQAVTGSGGAAGCGVVNPINGTSSTVPDGTLIIALSGSIYQCKNGTWVKQSLVKVGGPVRVAPPVGPGPIAFAPATAR